MIDFAEFQRKGTEESLKEAIQLEYNRSIVKHLRELTSPLPVEIVYELADYLDQGQRKKKGGRKPTPPIYNPLERPIINDLENFSDPDYARYQVNSAKKEFKLAKGTEPLDENGIFSPQWMYPHMEQERNQAQGPNDDEIMNYLLTKHDIDSRTLEHIVSKRNEQLISEFQPANDYYQLCWDREYARYLLNTDKVAFELVEGAGIFNKFNEFDPSWKHPHMNRERDRTCYPTCEEIQVFVCDKYGFSSSTFTHDHLPESNQLPIYFYKRLLNDGFSPDEARRYIYESFKINPGKFGRIIKGKGIYKPRRLFYYGNVRPVAKAIIKKT